MLWHLKDSSDIAAVRLQNKAAAQAGTKVMRRLRKDSLALRDLHKFMPRWPALKELQLSSALTTRHSPMLLQLTSLNLRCRHYQDCAVIASLTNLAELRVTCLQNAQQLTALQKLTKFSTCWPCSGIESILLGQLKSLELMFLHPTEVKVLHEAAAVAQLTGLTALSFHALCLPNPHIWMSGAAAIREVMLSQARIVVSSMAHLAQLRICDAKDFPVSALSACQQLKVGTGSISLNEECSAKLLVEAFAMKSHQSNQTLSLWNRRHQY